MRRARTLGVSAAAGILASVLPAAPAAAWNFRNYSFYGGAAEYFAETQAESNGMRSIKMAPRVNRSMYYTWSPNVCDYTAAIQFYMNGYWYPYTYSSTRWGCSWGFGYFDFHGWSGAWYPANQTYTHGWWVDSNTGGWRLVGNGWV